MHARRSLLFDKEQAWMKKGESGEFDIAMGSYDGAEVCELVGTFILSKLAPLLNQTNVGLYRDDGLGVVRKAPGPVLDRLRKDIIAVFLSLGLKITIDINLLHVNYLDVAMSLASGTFGPYLKPNATPMYINASSNHPPQIIRNIPTSINKRLSQISSSKEVFDDAKRVYQDALTASGYDYTLEFSDGSAACPPKRRQRGRNVIWYNPPYSKNVKTNIGGSFLRLIRKHFPKGSALGKLFNKNNVKISYSCTTNMASLIKKHNTTMLKPAKPPAQCNCRVKTSCPLNGDCKAANIVYEATVRAGSGSTKKYIGLTADTFKSRYANHTSSMRHERYANSSELAKHIWTLKNGNEDYAVTWQIKDRAKAYNNISKKCELCTTEKLHIMTADKSEILNRRTELTSKCRHERKFLLAFAVT